MRRKTVQIEDKELRPAEQELVTIRLKPGRAIVGIGTDGEVVAVAREQAEYAVKIGFAEYVVNTEV